MENTVFSLGGIGCDGDMPGRFCFRFVPVEDESVETFTVSFSVYAENAEPEQNRCRACTSCFCRVAFPEDICCRFRTCIGNPTPVTQAVELPPDDTAAGEEPDTGPTAAPVKTGSRSFIPLSLLMIKPGFALPLTTGQRKSRKKLEVLKT